MPSPRIILIGATGYTGRLVARALAGGGLPFLLAGRSPDRLDRVARALGGAPTQRVDVTDGTSLRHAVGRGDVVINCAGPFTELGEPVVAACVEAGAHYLDTTGELAFMRRILRAYDDRARAAGVAVVNAMAFEFALGDCAAALAAQGLVGPLRSLDATYQWGGSASAISRGTRRSVLHVVGGGGLAYVDGEWVPRRIGAERRVIELADGRTRAAVSIPAGEVLMAPRHIDVRTVRGWAVVGGWTARLARPLAPALPVLARVLAPLADRLLRRTAEGPTEEARRASEFQILVDAVGYDGERRRIIVSGRDPYGLTAAIAVRGARHLLERTRASSDDAPRGVLAPAQVLEPRALLDGLADHGLEWRAESVSGGLPTPDP